MKQENLQIIKQLTCGMDGRNFMPANISKIDSTTVVTAGDGVDFAIYAAFSQAERQGEDVREVLCHIEYITDQLAIFRRNLEAHVDALDQDTAEETLRAKIQFA